MATTPLAYNPSLSPIDGTDQVGTLAVGITDQDYSIEPGGVTWWMGPDEENGYVISIPVSGNTQPTPISGVTASVGFYQSTGLTDISFVQLTNNQFNQNFSSATDASIWLTNNGYWNSYPAPVLYLDAGNTASYPGTGTVWTDLVGGKVFNLINGPSYDPESSDSIYFNAASNQYANCSTSLPSLPIFTTTVWHYWDGTNSGGLPCILTEVYTGSINYFVGAPQGVVAQGGYFNGGFQLSPQFTLTPSTWYNIVVTCDANQIVKIYINGTLISSTATSGPQPSSSNAGINLMRRWDNAEFWGGYLSTVGIYDKALTLGQVSGIYNTTKSRYGYGPTPTPTPTLTPVMETPTPTPTVTQTPTATDLTNITTYTISGCTSLNEFVANLGPGALAPGDVFYFNFTGGTPSGCYRIVNKINATPTDGTSPIYYYSSCALCVAAREVTPTPTPTGTPTPTPTGTPVSVTPTPTPTTPPILYAVSISTVYEDDIGACGGNANITAYSTNNGYPQLGDIYYTTGAGTTTYGAGWYLNGTYNGAIELDTSGALINGPNSC